MKKFFSILLLFSCSSVLYGMERRLNDVPRPKLEEEFIGLLEFREKVAERLGIEGEELYSQKSWGDYPAEFRDTCICHVGAPTWATRILFEIWKLQKAAPQEGPRKRPHGI